MTQDESQLKFRPGSASAAPREAEHRQLIGLGIKHHLQLLWDTKSRSQ